MQKQVELSREREELNRAMEEMKLMDEEEKKRYISKHLGNNTLFISILFLREQTELFWS